jgi:RNA polymerase sigma-70 factor (ECF subfamily)
VQGICRRILRNEHDIEDVFQTTFWILARKADVVPWRDSVAGWLGAVAHRLALNTRTKASRRRGREVPMNSLVASRRGPDPAGLDLPEELHPLSSPISDLERRDLRQVLDDELVHLPEKYRAPVVLCYLEGRTHQEAARELGWPSGSMSRRLERARILLRRRLIHRGVALALIGALIATFMISGVSTRTALPQDRARLVRSAMAPFKPSDQGGQGLWEFLSTLAREDPSSPPDHAQALILAQAAAKVARQVQALDPDDKPDLWRTFATDMQLAASQLAQAAQTNDRLGLLLAARRLDASCLKCHEAFSQHLDPFPRVETDRRVSQSKRPDPASHLETFSRPSQFEPSRRPMLLTAVKLHHVSDLLGTALSRAPILMQSCELACERGWLRDRKGTGQRDSRQTHYGFSSRLPGTSGVVAWALFPPGFEPCKKSRYGHIQRILAWDQGGCPVPHWAERSWIA